jgi:hypothetical protein
MASQRLTRTTICATYIAACHPEVRFTRRPGTQASRTAVMRHDGKVAVKIGAELAGLAGGIAATAGACLATVAPPRRGYRGYDLIERPTSRRTRND